MSNKKIDLLKKYAKATNIVDLLEGNDDYPEVDDRLKAIANEVVEDFDDDLRSRTEWEDTIDEGMEMAKLKWEEKDFPWQGAANLKHPTIAVACIQYAAYSYPEIVRNDRVCEVATIGYDYDGQKSEKATRLSKFLNFQLLIENSEWTVQLDKLLQMLPAQGVVYKKIYWDPIKKKIKTDLCGYKEIVVNHYIKDLEAARRISHIMVKHKNEIKSKMVTGLYSEVDLEKESHNSNPHNFRTTDYTEYLEDNEYEVIEQHRWLDLDDDGFEEPYIVTVLSESKQVLRIAARYSEDDIKVENGEVYDIEPEQYFIDYHYIPSPDGCYHSMSAASLLLSHNKGINSVLNQLVNAGTLATTQGGFFAKTTKIKGGKLLLEPGEFIKTDCTAEELDKGIKFLEFKEPSSVLFNLLGFLVEGAKELASISDVMTGKQNAQNVQATTIEVLAEKGAKVFSSIQRRNYNSLAKEFKAIFILNRHHLDVQKYQAVLDYMQPVTLDDFDTSQYDIAPVADPNMSSDVQRARRAEQEMSMLQIPQVGNNPKAVRAIIKHYCEANNIPNTDQILPDEEQQKSGPDPKVMKIMLDSEKHAGELDIKGKKLELDIAQFKQDQAEKDAKIQLMIAQAQNALAQAMSTGGQQGIQQAQHQLEVFRLQMEGEEAAANRMIQQQQMMHEEKMRKLDFQDRQVDRQQKTQENQQKIQIDQQKHQMDVDNQKQQQSQQLQFEKYRHDTQLGYQSEQDGYSREADLYKHESQLDHDSRNTESQQGLEREKMSNEYNNQREQRDHDRDIEQTRMRTTSKGGSNGVAKPPRK